MSAKFRNILLSMVPLSILILIILGLSSGLLLPNHRQSHNYPDDSKLATVLKTETFNKLMPKNYGVQEASIRYVNDEPFAFVTFRNSLPPKEQGPYDPFQYLGIYRISPVQEVFLSSIHYAALKKIGDINKDEIEEIILNVGWGGNCNRCGGIAILQLQEGDLVNLTPVTDNNRQEKIRYASGHLKDLNGDGIQELLVKHLLCDMYADFAHAATPIAYQVYYWKKGKYRASTTDEFAWYYNDKIKELKNFSKDSNPHSFLNQLIVMLLYYDIKGQINKGWKEFVNLVEKYELAETWSEYEWGKRSPPRYSFDWYVADLYSRFFPNQPGPVPLKEMHISKLPKKPPTADQSILAFFDALFYGSNLQLDWWGSIAGGVNGYRKAYQYLSQSFKKQTSFEEFCDYFRGVASVELLQLYRGRYSGNGREQRKRYFAEIKTIEEIPDDQPKSGFVWYAGFVSVVQERDGWFVDQVDLEPEDLISQLGGHQPWRLDPVVVAGVEAKEELETIGIKLGQDLFKYGEAEEIYKRFYKVTFTKAGQEVIAWMVRMFNDECMAIEVFGKH